MSENDPSTTAGKRGRPRVYATAAERQRAYRQRLKLAGKRVLSRVVRDVRVGVPLESNVIDLSAIRPW